MKKLILKNFILLFASTALLVGYGCKGLGPDLNPKNNPIIIDGNSTLPLVWKNNPDAAVDYLVKTYIDVDAGKNLVIEPGVTVQFEGLESGIRITEGSLKAIGNASAPITFEGKIATKGSWKGILFESNSLDNRLEHVIVRHAGSEKLEWLDQKAAVGIHSVWGTVRLAMSNCTLSENDGYGFGAWGNRVNLTEHSGNTYSRNTLAPVYLTGNLVNVLDQNSNYQPSGSENGRAFIYVDADYPLANTEFTLRRFSVPYRIRGKLEIKRRLTIEAGAILEFEPGSQLFFQDAQAALEAVGSATQKIIFRGYQPVGGSWIGIGVYNNNVNNRLEHCLISDGGESANYFYVANLEIGGFASSPSCIVRNCEIRNSKGYGISYPGNASGVVLEGNTFSNNQSGDIHSY